MLLAGTPPGDLLALERTRINDKIDLADPTVTVKEIKNEERAITINSCQTRWSRGVKGEWTRRLLPDLKRWWSRSPQPLTYHLTQALSGHGCFRHYLRRMNRSPGADCLYCHHPEETAEHTIFECPHWSVHRLPVRQFTGGRDPRPSDVQDLLCGPEDLPPGLHPTATAAKASFIKMVSDILSIKEEDERRLEAAAARAARRPP